MKVIIQNQIIDLSLVWRIGEIILDDEYSYWDWKFTIYFLNGNSLDIIVPTGFYVSESYRTEDGSYYCIDKGKKIDSSLSPNQLQEKLISEEPYLSRLANVERMRNELATLWNGSKPPYHIIKLSHGLR